MHYDFFGLLLTDLSLNVILGEPYEMIDIPILARYLRFLIILRASAEIVISTRVPGNDGQKGAM